MQSPVRETTIKITAWTSVFVALLFVGTANISGALASEASAKNLFKAMSDYLASQKVISFEYNSNLEVITTQNQKLGLASSGTVMLNRPDKIRATRKGGFSNVELVFNGKKRNCSRVYDQGAVAAVRGSASSVRRMASRAGMERRRAVSRTDRRSA